jgi:hypothetical protein
MVCFGQSWLKFGRSAAAHHRRPANRRLQFVTMAPRAIIVIARMTGHDLYLGKRTAGILRQTITIAQGTDRAPRRNALKAAPQIVQFSLLRLTDAYRECPVWMAPALQGFI